MKQSFFWCLILVILTITTPQTSFAISNTIEVAEVGCPAETLKGEGRWENGAYGGSWKVVLRCANGSITGKVKVGSSNSCDSFAVAGQLKDDIVRFNNTESSCGSWDISIPLKKGSFDFSPDSGRYSGVEIIGWKWESGL